MVAGASRCPADRPARRGDPGSAGREGEREAGVATRRGTLPGALQQSAPAGAAPPGVWPWTATRSPHDGPRRAWAGRDAHGLEWSDAAGPDNRVAGGAVPPRPATRKPHRTGMDRRRPQRSSCGTSSCAGGIRCSSWPTAGWRAARFATRGWRVMRAASSAGPSARLVLRTEPALPSRTATNAWRLTAGKQPWGHETSWDPQRRVPLTVAFFAVPVWLPDGPGAAQPLWLVVSRGRRGTTPWRLLTTEPIHSAEEARRIGHVYARRWQIEAAFRFSKSEPGAESVRVRNWDHRLKRLGLLTLADAFLVHLLVTQPAHVRRLLRLGAATAPDAMPMQWPLRSPASMRRWLPSWPWPFRHRLPFSPQPTFWGVPCSDPACGISRTQKTKATGKHASQTLAVIGCWICADAARTVGIPRVDGVCDIVN